MIKSSETRNDGSYEGKSLATWHYSTLSQVDRCKYLGIIIQLDPKWNTHVNYITAKADRTLGFLKQNSSCATLHTKKLAYTVFIYRQLEYTATV